MKTSIELNNEKIDFTINQNKRKVTATTYWTPGKKYAKWECEGYPENFDKNTLIFFWLNCNIYKIKQY